MSKNKVCVAYHPGGVGPIGREPNLQLGMSAAVCTLGKHTSPKQAKGSSRIGSSAHPSRQHAHAISSAAVLAAAPLAHACFLHLFELLYPPLLRVPTWWSWVFPHVCVMTHSVRRETLQNVCMHVCNLRYWMNKRQCWVLVCEALSVACSHGCA